jgi:hypothetical protein
MNLNSKQKHHQGILENTFFLGMGILTDPGMKTRFLGDFMLAEVMHAVASSEREREREIDRESERERERETERERENKYRNIALFSNCTRSFRKTCQKISEAGGAAVKG